jgi:hypothetical protein
MPRLGKRTEENNLISENQDQFKFDDEEKQLLNKYVQAIKLIREIDQKYNMK